MPPREGLTVTHFITVASRILSRGDSKGEPGYIQIANTRLLVNIGGGPTPDKPSITLGVPADPDKVIRDPDGYIIEVGQSTARKEG
jgi:hypothetical protein